VGVLLSNEISAPEFLAPASLLAKMAVDAALLGRYHLTRFLRHRPPIHRLLICQRRKVGTLARDNDAPEFVKSQAFDTT
jgi:hypothetical protein